ncbi:MAG: toll/interleukin-1 receptor domain-containing protein [Bacteroidia bacterium]
MNAFISWSGDLSKRIAAELSTWLVKVIQSVKPFYSPDDIGVGNRWFSEIESHLSGSEIGILCITKENLNSSWLMFEAGALSKNIGQARVMPILFGVNHKDISGPLTQFQAIKFDKEDFKRLINTINDLLNESSLQRLILDEIFEKWWPDLEGKISNLLLEPQKYPILNKRTTDDILDELLERVRYLNNDVTNRKVTVSQNVTKELVGYYLDFCNGLFNDFNLISDDKILSTIIVGSIGRISFIEKPLQHLLDQTEMPVEDFIQLKKEFMEAKEKTRIIFNNHIKQIQQS